MLFRITGVMDLWSTSHLMKENPLTEIFIGTVKLWSAKKHNIKKSLQEIQGQFQNTYCTQTDLHTIDQCLLGIFNKQLKRLQHIALSCIDCCSGMS